VSHLIGAFLEMMSAERGAARNTIDAYRRDLSDYAGYVAGKQQTLLNVDRDTVNAFLDRLKQDGLSASSSARRLSAIRQFHKFLCADGMRGDDPTRIVASPKSRRALPKVLSLAEVDKLLATAEAEADMEASPQKQAAAQRLYVLLELLYATGLRVSELVSLRRAAVMRDASFLTVVGKGSKERIVPLNDRARDAIKTYLKSLEKGEVFLFPATGAGGLSQPAGLCPRPQGPGHQGGDHPVPRCAPRAAPCLCQPPAGGWSRPARGADAARPCRHFHHADLYPCAGREAAHAGRDASPAGGGLNLSIPLPIGEKNRVTPLTCHCAAATFRPL
jgi:Site-specific recombinase XerD